MLRTILIIAIGGAIGSVFRYLTYIFIQKYYNSVFPLATFLVNIIGCLLIGIFVGLIEKYELANSNIKWFLITGLCGGFTTFSAFGLENFSMFQNHQYGIAFLYIGLSVILGLLAVWLGLFLVK
ncbi:MAG TPA: fluoride efflux transporter CrcB [Flavobacterium sp.]|nr:fluoride efflux transporter CrcB [Flavobacterium sp.]